MKKIECKITGFSDSVVRFIGNDGEKRLKYISNGNFNHTYVGETVTLVVNNENVAIDCINTRHHSK